MSGTAIWLNYQFEVFPALGTVWNPVPAVYVFAGVNEYRQWVALYIGQTTCLADRFRNHERWPQAHRLGATHVHTLVLAHQAYRDALERALIQAYQPRLNQQLRQPAFS